MTTVEYFRDVVAAQKQGLQRGFVSICSAHPVVLEAAMAQAAEDGLPVLIESTVNQVNQFGGYTGMTMPGTPIVTTSSMPTRSPCYPHPFVKGDHMFRNQMLTTVLLCGLLLLVGPLPAQFNRTALLIDAPTADVLAPGTVSLTVAGSERTVANSFNPGIESDLDLRAGIVRGLELSVTAYTRADYVLNVSYQLPFLGGSGPEARSSQPLLAVGIHNIGINADVSSIGHGANVWPDERYKDEPYEAFSAFAVASVPVGRIVRIDAGLGRGQYVGYGSFTQSLNSDCLMGSHNQWAVGLFGGVEVRLNRYAALAAEVDGRDFNAGVKANLGPVSVGLAATKLEGLMAAEKFQRLSVAVSYRADNLLARMSRSINPRPGISRPQFGMLNGNIIDHETKLPLAGCRVRCASGEPKIAADDSGAFSLAQIPTGREVLIVEKTGYVPQTIEAEVTAGTATFVSVALEPEVAELPMPPMQLASAPLEKAHLNLLAMRFAPVYFDLDQSAIRPEAARILRDHAQTLKSNPDVRITILGFSDEIGGDDYNLALGKRRAESVLAYLTSLGVASDRMTCRSMGRVINNDPQWQNRRCDLSAEPK